MATVPESQPGSSPVTEDTDFGANDWLLEEMYEQYSDDPNSVDAAWAQYFATHGDPSGGATEGTGAGGNGSKSAGAAANGVTGKAATGFPSSCRMGGNSYSWRQGCRKPKASTWGRSTRPKLTG